jgi:hypothetical protein
MRYVFKLSGILIITALLTMAVKAQERAIGEKELRDKISAFWLGQIVGNYYGLPFENIYVDEPVPFLVDRVYTYEDDPSIPLNRHDWRGFIPVFMNAVEGAFADDDTDIEFITLHAVEKYGLDITYPEITGMWKRHINRRIWVANHSARSLMDKGLVAPETGRKENNPNWFQIDPQLVNEIWSAFYPGMTNLAAERALWGARITNDDWGTHPTIAYGVMISAAFFEKDVHHGHTLRGRGFQKNSRHCRKCRIRLRQPGGYLRRPAGGHARNSVSARGTGGRIQRPVHLFYP